jgi:hypothetical protein
MHKQADLTVATLDDTDRPTTADLTRRLGVTLAAMPITAEVAIDGAGLFAKSDVAPTDPVRGRTASPETEASEAITGEPAMQDTGQRTKAAGVPDHLTDLAASVLQHLREVQAHNRELTEQLAELTEAHRRDAMELVAAETREMATKEELERALAAITGLQHELARSRSPWWKKR